MKTRFRNKESKRLPCFATCLLISFLVSHNANAQQIHLNEVMSSNGSVISDEDGDFGDWIEIFNSGEAPISLGGYGLSDNYDSPFKWVFPDTTLGTETFLLIWATNKDRTTPGNQLHTNYAIGASGEEVILTHPDGTRIDDLEPIEIPRDISIGRNPDGTGDWVLFDEPTPGQSNMDGSTIHLLEPPQFSHTAGFYSVEFMLEITHQEDDVTIYYTIDGSDPTTSSEIYTIPIHIYDRTSEPNQISTILTNDIDVDFRRSRPPSQPIKKGTVIRTLTVKEGYSPDYSTQSYFVFPAGPSTHQLAVISISTDQKNLFDDEIGIYVPGKHYIDGNQNTGNYFQRGREWEREAGFEFFDENGELQFSQNVGLRIHGGLTRMFTQKSLRVYARGEYGESYFNYQIFPDQPYDSYKRLLLRNSGGDQAFSMIRDAVAHRIVSHFNMDTQAYRPAIVYINGEYWGLHNIRERYDRHYLERVYGIDPDNIDLLTANWLIKEGSNQEYLSLLTYIENENLADDQNYEYVKNRMDIDNYLDYFSAEIFLANTDWPYGNIDYWRSRSGLNPNAPPGQDGRWRWLFYDLDFSFGMATPADFDMIEWVTRVEAAQGHEWPNTILRNLLENETFKTDFINRMADHLNTAFLPERMESIITQMKSVIEPEMDDYGIRWRFPFNANVWNRTIDSMIEWAHQRYGNHWQHIMDHYDISSTETVTVSTGDESLGHIKVNSLDITSDTPGISENPYPWTGTYFSGIPITIRPVAAPLYRFSHWNVDGVEVYTRALTVLPEEVDHIELVVESISLNNIHAWKLSDAPYLFNNWNLQERAGAYPESMAFVYMSDQDPGLEAEIGGLVSGQYDLDSRTRINGLGEDGFSFINTGNPEGNPGYPGSQLGGAVLTLNLEGQGSAMTEWTAGTIQPGSRIYHLRLQYRLHPDEPFRDLVDKFGNPVEYQRVNEAGHSKKIDPVLLPQETDDQPFVQLMWRYYYTGERESEESGQRSQLSISEIRVWSQPLLGVDPGEPTGFRLFQNYPNPFFPTSTIRYDIPVDQHVRIDLYTITGQFVRNLVNRPVSAGRHSVILDATFLSSGVYIYRLVSEDFSDSVKMSVIK